MTIIGYINLYKSHKRGRVHCRKYAGYSYWDMAMEKTKESFLENIKKAFAAFSYEHSGEMLSSHSKNRVLSGGYRDKTAKNTLSRNVSSEHIMPEDKTKLLAEQ